MSADSADSTPVPESTSETPPNQTENSYVAKIDVDTSDDNHANPDFRSQIEKDLDDGRRDHLSANHDFFSPGSSSLASILAQQVAKKSAKTEGEEFLYGD